MVNLGLGIIINLDLQFSIVKFSFGLSVCVLECEHYKKNDLCLRTFVAYRHELV